MAAKKRFSPRLILAILGVGLLGWLLIPKMGPKQDTGGSGGPGGMRRGGGVIPVTTTQVRVANIPVRVEGIGTVEAFESVSIQARIGGQLSKVHFNAGDFVKAGQLLFTIDPSVVDATAAQARSVLAHSQTGVGQARADLKGMQAQVKQTEAALHRDEAQLTYAKAQEARYRSLLALNYVTQEQYGQMKANLDAAQATALADRASVAQARSQVASGQVAIQTSQASAAADRAALESAQLQVGFTKIRSPINGKTGPLLLYAGNIVQPNVTPLVNILRLMPIRVTFSIPEKQLPAVQKSLAATRSGVPIEAIIPGEPPEHETGHLAFVDNTVDATNGTVRLKGEFANLKHRLWPGRFVTVRVNLGTQANALVLPAKAVQTGQNGDFVYGIDSQQKAQFRPVKVERIVDDQAVISQGLKAGDTVVLDGGPKLAPGLKVRAR